MHQVYAVKFGEARGGTQSQYFLRAPAGCADEPGQLDFMLWLIRGPSGDIVVDAGFTADTAQRRGRTHFREPSDGLRLLDVDCSGVKLVVLTHLHYDHCGDLAAFPSATFVVHQDEMAFWTGATAARGQFRRLVEPDDIAQLVRWNLDGRVLQVTGDRQLVPGVMTHHVGGHTPGTQVVSVETARGTVVLASDASHLRSHIVEDSPSNLVTDLPRMYEAFDVIHALASTPELIIPGHDPDVFSRYAPMPGLEGIAARIA